MLSLKLLICAQIIMREKRVLIIGLVWPEPTSSAAGTRMIQLLEVFLGDEYEVIFASAASKSAHSHDLQQMGIREAEIKLNDESFNDFIHHLSPSVIMFDRYMTEEQYGWRVRQECPSALTILDTEDLHCLRQARQQSVRRQGNAKDAELYSEVAKREIAAILRCDISLIISEIEIDLLVSTYNVDRSLLYYLPFLEHRLTADVMNAWPTFQMREGFVFIGNFLHEPNWYTLQVLKKEVWPVLSRQLPGVKMHIYGAYPGQKVLQLHKPAEHFLIHGRAEDAKAAVAKHRLLLAPIRFGAGLKGKFIDAMLSGTPTVTTTLGAEAMAGNLPWNGAILDDIVAFCNAAAKLYTDELRWKDAVSNGVEIINTRFTGNQFVSFFLEKLQRTSDELAAHRQKNFIGQILQHQTLNSLKYMSMWIEEKNKQH